MGCLRLAITDQTQQNLGTIHVSTSQSLSIDIFPFLLLPWTGRSPDDPSFLWCILFVFDCIATLYSLYFFFGTKSLRVWHLGTKNSKPIKSPNKCMGLQPTKQPTNPPHHNTRGCVLDDVYNFREVVWLLICVSLLPNFLCFIVILIKNHISCFLSFACATNSSPYEFSYASHISRFCSNRS